MDENLKYFVGGIIISVLILGIMKLWLRNKDKEMKDRYQ